LYVCSFYCAELEDICIIKNIKIYDVFDILLFFERIYLK